MGKTIPACSVLKNVQSMSASHVANENQCALGRWLQKKDQKVPFSKRQRQDLMRLHAQVHAVALEVFAERAREKPSAFLHKMEQFTLLWEDLVQRLEVLNAVSS